MKKIGIFGMAIIALVILGISYVPTLFLENGDRLVWQLSNWAWMFASLLIAIIGVLLTIRFTKGKHILWKIVVRSRQLHIYRNGKKVLVLAGKAAPKVIREDRLCEILP